MLDSHPPQSPGRLVGLAIIASVILLDLGMLLLLFIAPVSVLTVFLSLFILTSFIVIAFIAYVTSGIANVRYRVENGLLVIEWGRILQVIPLKEILSIVPSEALESIENFRGVRWPGCMIGLGSLKIQDGSIYPTTFFSTRMLEQQVLIVTDSMAYGLSPGDPFSFIASLQALMKGESDADQVSAYSDLDILEWSIWRDRAALLLASAPVILNLTLFAFLATAYSRLPEEVPLHYNQVGIIDRAGSPAGLFILPLIGLVAWTTTGLTGWFYYAVRLERPVAYIVWGITVVIEVAAWVALVGLIY
jgi:hypothetical protein